ncbi:hypothetical protein EB73_28365 [Mycobacterium sp. SWH-M3]|nr:hypothetical protein EB73_28365 [Mycobacterium sp. SWH-M3]
MRASGAVMGLARESFGAGGGPGGVSLLDAPLAPQGSASGSGAAAQGFSQESDAVGRDAQALADQDVAANAQLTDALGAAGVGRARMDSVIAAAVADVEALGLSTSTPEGQRALVAAIRRHLEDTKSTLQGADADATTRAAGADTSAAGYSSVGATDRGAAATVPASASSPAMPMGMPTLPTMPSMPMGGGGLPLSSFVTPLSALSGLTNAGVPASSIAAPDVDGHVPASGASPASSIPVSQVNFDRLGFASGREAYRGYIAKALDVMGISDPQARANWARGLEVAASRESGFNPEAVNKSDSNAHGARMSDGAPANSSRGGLQTIPTTFAANHQPGTSTHIYDPVANICAAMNYVMGRYHVQRDGSNLSSVGQFNPNHAPQGY